MESRDLGLDFNLLVYDVKQENPCQLIIMDKST